MQIIEILLHLAPRVSHLAPRTSRLASHLFGRLLPSLPAAQPRSSRLIISSSHHLVSFLSCSILVPVLVPVPVPEWNSPTLLFPTPPPHSLSLLSMRLGKMLVARFLGLERGERETGAHEIMKSSTPLKITRPQTRNRTGEERPGNGIWTGERKGRGKDEG